MKRVLWGAVLATMTAIAGIAAIAIFAGISSKTEKAPEKTVAQISCETDIWAWDNGRKQAIVSMYGDNAESRIALCRTLIDAAELSSKQ